MAWTSDQGIDVSSAFQGITIPPRELYDEIHQRGWDVQKVDYKEGQCVATVKNPYGETIEKTGPDPATALGNSLVAIMRLETMRSPVRTAAWEHTWENQLPEIAKAYAQAPTYDPKAAGAWKELADDSTRRAEAISNQLNVEFTNDPYPYEDVNEMADDIRNKQHVQVSRANLAHPLWSTDQALAYRLVHDVLGHASVGGDWGWHGENGATAAHMPLLSPEAQKALFTEAIGQAAHNHFYRQLGPQKITFLDKYLEDAQEAENAAGHGGVHPSQSIVPTGIPSIPTEEEELAGKTSAATRSQLLRMAEEHAQANGPDTSQVLHEWPDGWTVRSPQTDTDHSREGTLMSTCIGMPQERGGTGPLPPNSYESLRDPDNLPHATWANFGPPAALGRHNRPVNPEYAKYLQEYGVPIGDPQEEYTKWYQYMVDNGRVDPGDPRIGSVASKVDPNDGWESGVEPLPDNAYLWQKEESGLDPLDYQGIKEQAYKVDPHWSQLEKHDGMPDLDSQRQAVINAFRSVLLQPRQTPRWGATHYQHIQNLPATVSDPVRFSDALDVQREAHNQARGLPAGIHRAEWDPMVGQFSQWIKGQNPTLDDSKVDELARRELFHMVAEEEEKVTGEDPGGQLLPMQISDAVNKALKKRLSVMLKSNVDQKVDFGKDRLFHKSFGDQDMGVYGDFLNSHLRPIAGAGLYADRIASAAREDVAHHGGKGHHFRAQVSDLVPGIGPKEVSHAWSLLQPHTSQLAVISPSLAETLGHDRDTEISPRDYFKLERQLASGRDAAGYNHVPLGQFSWGMYDRANYGHGVHRDLSPFAPVNPTPYNQVDWTQYPSLPTQEWDDPYWWDSTEPMRDEVGNQWDQMVATQYPKEQIPYRTAGMSGGQRLRALEEADQTRPDTSDIVHEFPNGYTIRKLNTWGDKRREGELMHNCWANPLGAESLGVKKLYDNDPMTAPEWPLPVDHYSLRDQYNFPHVSFFHEPTPEAGPHLTGMAKGFYGHGNAQVSPEYKQMLQEWAKESNVHINPNDWRGQRTTPYDNVPEMRIAGLESEPYMPPEPDLTNGQWSLPQSAQGVELRPYFMHPESGEMIEGNPNQTIMQHVRNALGLSTEDIWAMDPEVGKH